ncbi:DUF397 domain-containing protein [Nocardia cyriacigeorgica]|uniref:DUF397 domain-containing protein n=1 Tax=Nocardia cyriacigeorgica TaxID=135487 RepID=UPI001895887B|nr:DUF397 domain-containing protein [Nocardia cyriacigeorgica]MBF6100164.1 DUF397 domain-containing protein [Nocardia cyriacigeorgica]MBF6163088.1 DUF397 domain-containing protein [Nocardia cyriacigeorgica]MBF6202056.1 DUF397 domain-containing protein [Nocardia cyriacigeorgica]MBF6318447.1 DUF397 domain-containing protein [Nocardia cyriacigeorgica]MBF6517474.1 DUF397 domain-containing protein [Nocardia cyriacigeorgica]
MSTDDRLAWRTSSYSSNGEACVEVAPAARRAGGAAESGDHEVYVRHSKRPDAGTIAFTASDWTALIGQVRAGSFDLTGGVTVQKDGTETILHARDTGVTLRFDQDEWEAFIAGADAGEFDHARLGGTQRS